MYADFHIHSEFSDDSSEPMERHIERAIALGFSEICFTDHVDYGIKKDWSEGGILWRQGDGGSGQKADPLANVDYPEYFEKLSRLQKTFRDRLRIRKGLEFGIQTHTVPRYEALFDRYASELDFVLLSIHQVADREFWNGDYQRGKTREEYNRGYYEELLSVLSSYDRYSVLAHLDLIVRYDPAGSYPFDGVRDVVAAILEKAIRDGKGIELNTSSWRYGLADTQPSRQILSLYRDLGGRIITLGSDAHAAGFLGDHIPEAMEILRNLGYTEFCTFDHMEPVFHRL